MTHPVCGAFLSLLCLRQPTRRILWGVVLNLPCILLTFRPVGRGVVPPRPTIALGKDQRMGRPSFLINALSCCCICFMPSDGDTVPAAMFPRMGSVIVIMSGAKG